MPLIVVDGPQGQDRSLFTAKLAREARTYQIRQVRDLQEFDHRVYAELLSEDVKRMAVENSTIIWNGSWLSQIVRGDLDLEPFTAEWLYGRAVDACGIRAVIMGPSADPAEDGKRWGRALANGWLILAYQEQGMVVEHARRLVGLAHQRCNLDLLPPTVAGPLDAETIVVGESRSAHRSMVGGWLPFTSRLTFQLAERMLELGGEPLNLLWANAHDFPPQQLRWYRTVIACGNKAQQWCRLHGGIKDAVEIPHPSWLYRYNSGKTNAAKEEVDETLRQLIDQGRI